MRRSLRQLYQRFATDLPWRHAPFRELFADANDQHVGVNAVAAGFTGVLQEEKGTAFALEPTRYADGRPGTLAGEDRRYVVTEPTRTLYAMSPARVISPQGICYQASTRTVVRETLEDWENPLSSHAIFSTPGFPRAQPLRGISLSLATLGGETFYHFLLESLPKLALARTILPRIDQLLVPRYIESAKSAWLAHFGFNQKIVWLGHHAHWDCDQLIFTSRVARHFEPNAWCVRTLRTMAGVSTDGAHAGAAVWLDRSATSNRQVSWEPEFARQLDGVTPVDFGALTPAAVIARCRTTRVFVGLHGAAFANMVFSPPGARIIELMPRPFHPFYARLAQACGHEHYAIRISDSATGRAEALEAIKKVI